MSIGDILPWRRDKGKADATGSLVFDQERRGHRETANENSPAAQKRKAGVHQIG